MMDNLFACMKLVCLFSHLYLEHKTKGRTSGNIEAYRAGGQSDKYMTEYDQNMINSIMHVYL